MIETFKIDRFAIKLYDPQVQNCPIVFLNCVNDETDALWKSAQAHGLPPFALAAISNLEWDTDLSPWYCPPAGPDDVPCQGGADDYLKILTEQIIPESEKRLQNTAEYRIIAGYSLAGLFALYSLYQSDLFERCACGSGSFWFPDFIPYVETHQMKRKPEKLYFSLGEQESRTKNRLYSSVLKNTKWLAAYYQKEGIETEFVLENGNHFTDVWGRMERALAWTLAPEIKDHAKKQGEHQSEK